MNKHLTNNSHNVSTITLCHQKFAEDENFKFCCSFMKPNKVKAEGVNHLSRRFKGYVMPYFIINQDRYLKISHLSQLWMVFKGLN